MQLGLTDDQRLLKDSVERLVADRYDFDQRRAYLREPFGFGAANWALYAELGWLAIPIAEEDGGLGGSAADMAVIGEALGRGLAVEPLAGSLVLAAGLLRRCGDDAPRKLLEKLAGGTWRPAVAFGEADSRFNLNRVATRCDADQRLSGEKRMVLAPQGADALIVTAVRNGALGVYLVESGAPGQSLEPHTSLDGTSCATVRLTGAPAQCLAHGNEAAAILAAAVDDATAYLCAEALGVMQFLLDTTVGYVKTRIQFDQPLAKLQAVRHRLADMAIALEMARGAVLAAVGDAAPGIDLDPGRVSTAKVKVGDAAHWVGGQSVQLHGGIGMTEELAVAHGYKRLLMIDGLFGDRAYHLARLARR